MKKILTSILTLLLSLPVLQAQSDDATLINVTTLDQLNAIRYDLDGDGVVVFTTEAPLATSTGNVDALAALSRYASQFTGGTYHTRAGGSDTPIANASAEAVVANTTYVYKLSGTYEGYELMNNLDFERSRWADGASGGDAVTDGWESIGEIRSRFTAIFEGNGHTISNLFIDRSSTDYVGLFGYVSEGSAALRNLGMVDVEVTGYNQVGGLVGFNRDGTVSNSYATGSVTGNGYVGGLVGRNEEGTVSNNYATGAVGGVRRVGGLVGYNVGGTVSNSYATGAVTGKGLWIGGLVGYNVGGTVSNSYATGAVSGVDNVGGLVGRNFESTVSGSYATGAVTGSSDVGGLVGGNHASSTITASYYNSHTTGQSDTGKGEGKTTAELLDTYGLYGYLCDMGYR